MKLDLGAYPVAMLNSKVVEALKEKEFVELMGSRDAKGNFYSNSCFKIPRLSIHEAVQKKDVIIIEESQLFQEEGSRFGQFTKKEIQNELDHIDGRIGRKFFDGLICLVDVSRKFLFVAYNIKDIDWIQNGRFVEASFELDRGLIIIKVKLGKECRKMILDTGASISVSTKQNDIGRLKINGKTFGEWSFHYLPELQLFDDVDLILGMDFFQRHRVCFDFQANHVFIERM